MIYKFYIYPWNICDGRRQPTSMSCPLTSTPTYIYTCSGNKLINFTYIYIYTLQKVPVLWPACLTRALNIYLLICLFGLSFCPCTRAGNENPFLNSPTSCSGRFWDSSFQKLWLRCCVVLKPYSYEWNSLPMIERLSWATQGTQQKYKSPDKWKES